MATPTALILAANPAQEGRIQMAHSAIAHMAYRVEPGPILMRARGNLPSQGGLLYLCMDGPVQGSNLPFFLQQIFRECAGRNYRGVVADLPQGCGELAAALDGSLCGRSLKLYVPESLGRQAPHARLLISTALSGGTLRQRLCDARSRHGERAVPALERIAMDFTPPARMGIGRALDPEELGQLRQRWNASVFFSPDLCCRYFSYFDRGQGHIVLFDDRETMQAKLRLIRELGFEECLCAWGDLQ